MSGTKISIKHWSVDDRPREKLLEQGSQTLSDAELIAILIGSGNRSMTAVELSRIILNDTGNSLDKLGKTSVKNLMKYNGIGEAKAISITAALELGRRRAAETPKELPQVSKSNDAYNVLHPLLGELPHEEFWVLYLNNSNKIIAKHQISKGGFTGTLVDVRIVCKLALEENAVAMILSHNHPSGKLQPSAADRNLTDKLIKAAASLDLKVLDHLIITQQSFYSFADNALL